MEGKTIRVRYIRAPTLSILFPVDLVLKVRKETFCSDIIPTSEQHSGNEYYIINGQIYSIKVHFCYSMALCHRSDHKKFTVILGTFYEK
jgi:hypothetical protein